MVVVIGERLTAGGQPSLLHSLAAGSDGFEPLPLLTRTPTVGAKFCSTSTILYIRLSSKAELYSSSVFNLLARLHRCAL